MNQNEQALKSVGRSKSSHCAIFSSAITHRSFMSRAHTRIRRMVANVAVVVGYLFAGLCWVIDIRRTSKMSVLRGLAYVEPGLSGYVGATICCMFFITVKADTNPDWVNYQFLCNSYNYNYAVCFPSQSSAWKDSIDDVAKQECDMIFPTGKKFAWETVTSCAFKSVSVSSAGVPYITIRYASNSCGYMGSPPGCEAKIRESDWPFVPFQRFNPARFFLKTDRPVNSQPSSCCENKVADPIDPVSAATLRGTNDLQNGLGLHRFYSSQDATGKDIGIAWHHTYERKVIAKNSSLTTQLYSASSVTSSSYADAATACISGFAELQSKVSNWVGASASYSDGNCQLTKNGVSVGSVPVYYTRQSLPVAATPIAYDVIRDDGQLIRFTVINGTITPPPGTSLKLAQTSNGFTLTDGADTIEHYDTTGKLLSITSRSGVVQTMNYDGSGRLSGVTDSFGHQLIFSYDANGKLSSVTRQ